MSGTNRIDELFLKLHQLQVNLIKSTTKQSITEYNKELENILGQRNLSLQFARDTQSINFIEFLIFPVLTALKNLDGFQQADKKKQATSLDSSELLIKSICIVLSKTGLHSVNLFDDILSMTSMYLSKTLKKLDSLVISDEFYMSCFNLIQIIFQKSDLKVLENFYSFKSITSIGLLVSVFLEVLVTSTSLQVRISALNSLKALSYYESGNSQLLERIGVIFASFLPGISIKLIQNCLLSQNLKTLNHKLICTALEVLSHVIQNVFNDKFLDMEFVKKVFENCMNKEKDLPVNLKSLVINRIENKEWIKVSSEKLLILIERLLDALVLHDNVNVHLSLVELSTSIASECYFTLNDHLGVFFQILVTFASSTNDIKSASSAKEGLKLIEAKELTTKPEHTFLLHNKMSTVNKFMEELLLKLPRLMNDNNSKLCIKNMKTLYGYLNLVGSGTEPNQVTLKNFFYLNLQNVSTLLHGLISCVHFDYKNLNNLYQIEDTTSDMVTLSNYTGLSTYLNDTTLFEQLSHLCQYLGRSDAANLLIDELLTNDVISLQENQNQCEVMFIINLILKGVRQNPSKDTNSLVAAILSNFLNEKPKNYPDTNNNSSNTINKNRKLISSCLTLEIISISSECLAPDDFNMFLIETLYSVLENYMNNNLLTRAVAQKCLKNLSMNLQYESMQDLLSKNYDYIMNDLILKSHSLQMTVETLMTRAGNALNSQVHVLCALLDISNLDLVPYLERIIDDYFLMIELDSEDLNKLLGVCQIMIHLGKSMQRWYPVELNFCKDGDLLHLNLKSLADAKRRPDNIKSFVHTLNELNQSKFNFETNEMKLRSDSKKTPTEIIEENEEEMIKSMESIAKDDEARKKPTPLNVKLQKKCMDLCVHLISHPSKKVRLNAIQSISEFSRSLAEHENELLPLINNLWLPICQRFTLDDFIIKSKIVNLMFDLAVFCSEFLSSRFCKEFLPRLCTFMTDQARLSQKATKLDTTYIYSHAFKLQMAILTNLDKMCILFEIKDLELENFIEKSILMYLDKQQPKKLQQAALNALRNCSLIDPDLVWLCLHYVIPFSSLKEVNFEYSRDVKKNYDFKFSEDTLDGLLLLFNDISGY